MNQIRTHSLAPLSAADWAALHIPWGNTTLCGVAWGNSPCMLTGYVGSRQTGRLNLQARSQRYSVWRVRWTWAMGWAALWGHDAGEAAGPWWVKRFQSYDFDRNDRLVMSLIWHGDPSNRPRLPLGNSRSTPWAIGMKRAGWREPREPSRAYFPKYLHG